MKIFNIILLFLCTIIIFQLKAEAYYMSGMDTSAAVSQTTAVHLGGEWTNVPSVHQFQNTTAQQEVWQRQQFINKTQESLPILKATPQMGFRDNCRGNLRKIK